MKLDERRETKDERVCHPEQSEGSKIILSEVCEFIVDCPHSTANDEGVGFPLVRTPNVGKGRLVYNDMHRVSEDVYNQRNFRAVPQEDDLIFAREAPAGNVALIRKGEKVCLGQRTVLLRPNKQKVDPSFLTYYLLAPKQQYGLTGTANGATVAHVNMPTIRNLAIELPDIKVQRKLGGILSAYDNLIENNQKQIKLLEEAAQRLYKQWFIDLRYPGHETTKIVDGLPEGWHYGSITEISTCYDSKRKPLSSKERDQQEKVYPYYGAASLMDYVEKFIFDGVYLLFGEDGTVITSDETPMLQYVWGKFWVNNHAHIFQGANGYSTEFLYMLCKHMKIKDIVTGVAQPKISQGRLNDKKIVIPSRTMVAKYSELTQTVFKQIRLLSDAINASKEARDRLLPKLMNGEKEV